MHCNIKSGENAEKKKKRFLKRMQKKHIFFLVSCQSYQDLRHILQNTKLPRTIMGFNNHNLSRETLKHWALLDDVKELFKNIIPFFLFFCHPSPIFLGKAKHGKAPQNVQIQAEKFHGKMSKQEQKKSILKSFDSVITYKKQLYFGHLSKVAMAQETIEVTFLCELQYNTICQFWTCFQSNKTLF